MACPVAARTPLLHFVMPIHSVLLSASRMRLLAPGAPSLMATGLVVVLLLRFTTVSSPANRVSGVPETFTVCGCCPTTYIVEESTSALLAPPGMRMFVLASVALVGSVPEPCPTRKIIGATGRLEIDAVVPPHSGPQFRIYAVPPSPENTAFTGRSNTSGAP